MSDDYIKAQAARLAIDALMAEGQTRGVSRIVIPPLEKIVEARFGKGSGSYEIERLEADLRQAKISEVFWRDGWHALDQDKRAVEAKLAKAMDAMRVATKHEPKGLRPDHVPNYWLLRQTLKELEG